MKFRGFQNMMTCDWQQSAIAPDLEENGISAILCISKNPKPAVTIEVYTLLGIQHYSASLDSLVGAELEKSAIRIARIIHHFVSNNQRILIHNTNEECAVSFAMIFYLIYTYYHHINGEKKPVKKPEISISSQAIQELKIHSIESDLLQSMVSQLYAFENKYAATT